ncbi:MAG TPA: hypothetical protein VF976_12340 [Gemmatimonadales bacterium]
MVSRGMLGRQLPLPEGSWLVDSDVQLAKDKSGLPALRWVSRSADEVLREPARTRRWLEHTQDVNTPIVLDKFVALADAPPERVLTFVRRYGRLELCEKHRLPHLHLSAPHNLVLCKQVNPEPVAYYTHYGRVARALLWLAAAAHRGSVDRHEDWDDWNEAWDLVGGQAATPNLRTLGHVPTVVTLALRWWLTVGNVRAEFWWVRSQPPEVRLGGHGLWAAIARQLAFAVSRVDRMVACAGCGTLFTPTRLQTVRESWCLTCGKRAADRESKRRQRARARRDP